MSIREHIRKSSETSITEKKIKQRGLPVPAETQGKLKSASP